MRTKCKGNNKVAVVKESQIRDKNPVVDKNRIVNGKSKTEIKAPIYLKRAYRSQ